MLVNSIRALKEYLDDTKDRRNTWVIKLFVNDHTPAQEDTVDDYTEATFPGYAPQFLTDWGDAFENDDSEAQSDERIRGWLATGAAPGQQVYGYYVVNLDGLLMYAERNVGGAVPMSAAGNAYVVFPRVTMKNQ